MSEQPLKCHRSACGNTADVRGYNRVTHGLYCLECAYRALPSDELYPLLHLTKGLAGGKWAGGLVVARLDNQEVPHARVVAPAPTSAPADVGAHLLQEIAERWANATPGPWALFHCEGEYSVMPAMRPGDIATGIRNKADAQALAHAPTDIATLLAEVDRLTRLLAVERGDESAAPEGWTWAGWWEHPRGLDVERDGAGRYRWVARGTERDMAEGEAPTALEAMEAAEAAWEGDDAQ